MFLLNKSLKIEAKSKNKVTVLCSSHYFKIKNRVIIQQKANVRILCFGFGEGIK